MDQYISLRSWMYDRKYPGRRALKSSFKKGVREFVTFANARDVVKREGGIRCPCLKCLCGSIQSEQDVINHLERFGFMDGYYVWRHHGEHIGQMEDNMHASSSGVHAECENFGQMEDMVGDALGVNLSYDGGGEEEIIPNNKALKFYSMMDEVNKPLYEGSSDSKLSMCVRLLAARSNWNVPEDCLEFFSKMMLDSTPIKDNMPTSYYDAKRLVAKLGLEVKKIDCCVQGCMLFYDNEFGTNDGALNECKFCNAPRYQARNSDVHRNQKKVPVKSMFYLPIIPRLKRLFASMQTAGQMTWHYYNKTNSAVMRHPCDGLAWKHFDAMHPDFAEDPRNVRLGLCSDGFTPYIQASATPYSCWPIIVTPYNLPPEMCMTKPYMFLSCIIPGPSNPTDGIDVYLQPLIDDLKRLWIGELTYDIARKENFTMRAVLMWTINDFPAYGMLSGWSTHGRLACPHCMEHTKSFTLKNGGKTSWFDCHRRFLPKNHQFRRKKNLFKIETKETDGPPPRITSSEVFNRVSQLWKFPDVGQRIRYDGYGEWHNWTKRSIFWDLPYWKDNLLRHNLDVMHIEKNFCDNILHTVMNVSGKTKDNEKARLDLPLYCKRPESATTSSTSILPPNQPTPSQPTILPVHQPTPSYRPTFPARHSVSSFPSSSHHSIPPTETFSTQVAPSYGISPELFHDSSGNFLALLGTFNQPHQQQHQQSTPQEQEQQSTPQEQGRAARKQRRPRVTEDKIVAVGKRSVIYPIGRGLEPNKEASKGITTALRAIYQDAFFPTYHHLKKNKDAKKKIIAEFELCCAWKPEHDDEVIKIFHHLASSRLSGMLYEARQEYETRDGDFKPEWIGEEVWPQLLEYWQKDETFARRSSANKKNRDSKKGGYKHTQGSASVDTHRRALERQLGRKPFINEVHNATHKIWGTDEYIDTRSAVTQKKYDESVQSYLREHPEYSSNADLSEPTQLQMWDEISGPGNTDFRRYGYGNLAPNFEYGSMSYIPTGEEQYRSATVPPEMQQTIDTMTQQLQSQNQELQRRAQREKELEERLTKESEDRLRWQKQMEERFLYAYNSQPPPHHGSASRFDPSENESDNERDDFDEE